MYYFSIFYFLYCKRLLALNTEHGHIYTITGLCSVSENSEWCTKQPRFYIARLLASLNTNWSLTKWSHEHYGKQFPKGTKEGEKIFKVTSNDFITIPDIQVRMTVQLQVFCSVLLQGDYTGVISSMVILLHNIYSPILSIFPNIYSESRYSQNLLVFFLIYSWEFWRTSMKNAFRSLD